MTGPLRTRFAYRMGALINGRVSLGVRCLVTDQAGRILLVRHTYLSGWHMPGGGVDPGETAREAAVREVREEAGLTLSGAARFFGLYFNKANAKRDHVALFTVLGEPFDEASVRAVLPEIAAVRLASPAELPQDTSPATVRRIDEALNGAHQSEYW